MPPFAWALTQEAKTKIDAKRSFHSMVFLCVLGRLFSVFSLYIPKTVTQKKKRTTIFDVVVFFIIQTTELLF